MEQTYNAFDPYKLQTLMRQRDIEVFAREALGIPLHQGQIFWLDKSKKVVNVLKPGNQWGKTTIEAVKHVYEACCKPKMDRFNPTYDVWLRTMYRTLNFGKTYEVARGVQEAIVDMVEGQYLLPSGDFNTSLLSGWAMKKIVEPGGSQMPKIVWFNRSETLIRSYDDLGSAFKRLKLAFVSGDECGDIPELNLFLTGTLIPRIAFMRGSIDLVGTAQPRGIEYETLAESIEEEIKEVGVDEASRFIISFNTFPEFASVYANEFMPREAIADIEKVADPELRKQIIYGIHVNPGDKLYTFDECRQMFKDDIPYNAESGFSEAPQEEAFYVFSTDLAASTDETSCTCIKYNIRTKKEDGTFIQHPHKIVFHKAWKGNLYPLSLQYELIAEYFMMFKRVSPVRTTFLYDAGSLGGKNAEQAFKALHGKPFPPKGRSYAEIKAEMFGKIKEVLGRGRKFRVGEKGELIDEDPEWGGIRASGELKELRRQIETMSKDDKKLKNDQFSSLGMAIHYIEARAPKVSHAKAVTFSSVPNVR